MLIKGPFVIITDPEQAAMLLIALDGKVSGDDVTFTAEQYRSFNRLECMQTIVALQELAASRGK